MEQRIAKAACCIILALAWLGSATAEEIDASDPTKVYTYAGGGVKYTDYANGDDMTEIRVTGNLGISPTDMVMFEAGYGWHSGDPSKGTADEDDLTNMRFRYFHLFPMDYSVQKGYRGMASQIDVQLAGELIGTDGQNTITLGALPAFALGDMWSLYLPINVPMTWDKNFDNYNGTGIGVAPLLVCTPGWWNGCYVQFWPSYNYFVQGELEGTGSGNIDIITGGNFTPTVTWSVTGQKNVDKDLRTFRRDRDAGLKNDWNVFASATMYF